MNNGLQIFENEMFGNVRVLVDIDNEVWFVGKDVSSVLGYITLKEMYKHVNKEDKQEINPHNPESIANAGLVQNDTIKIEENENVKRLVIINESGLYDAVFGSKLPSAKAFKRWVTKEVLPQIRKTGNYISDRDRLLIDLHSNDAMVVANAHRKLVELETKPLIETIETQKPDVEFATKIQDDNEELYDMGSACRILKLKNGRNKLFTYLRDEKVLMSGINKNLPYQSYMDRGYFKVTLDMVNGKPFSVTKFTGKGLRWLNDKMNLGIDIDKELELENEVVW